MNLRLAGVAYLVVLLLAPAPARPPVQAVPETVNILSRSAALPPAESVLAWQTAVNAADLDASLSAFAPDAVVIQPRLGGLPQVFLGREQIRWWLDNLFAQRAQLSVDGQPELVGDRALWTGRLAVDAYRALDLESVEIACEAIFHGGLIDALTMVLTPAGARKVHLGPTPARDSVLL